MPRDKYRLISLLEDICDVVMTNMDFRKMIATFGSVCFGSIVGLGLAVWVFEL